MRWGSLQKLLWPYDISYFQLWGVAIALKVEMPTYRDVILRRHACMLQIFFRMHLYLYDIASSIAGNTLFISSNLILDDCLFVLCFVFVVTWLLLLVQKHTVALGAAGGQACLLLAAGTKGKRHMMPHAKGMME